MFHKRVVPGIVLLAWMPFLSAYASGEGVVDFRSTIGSISRLYRQLDYEQAFNQIEVARQRPLGTSELLTLSLYEGIILYELGRHVESGDAFQMALLIRGDARLPEPVAPKIESHFEAFRQRIQQELASAVEADADSGTSSATVSASPGCSPSRVAAKGRTLKAQQLWRLASMEQMLCTRGIRRADVAGTLSALTAQASEANTASEWMRLGQNIDRIAHQFALYPSNEEWRQAKSSVPEALWELGDEDQDVPLPEGPAASAVGSRAEEEPASLFGCRATVAVECDRLMRRLLLLQTQTFTMNAASKSAARKELFLLGQRVREASSSETLEEVSQDIDAWTGKWH